MTGAPASDRPIGAGSVLLQKLHDPAAGFSVPVRIDRLTHGPVMLGVVEQRADAPDDSVIIGTDQADRSGVERLGTLGRIAHDEHGLAEPGASS